MDWPASLPGAHVRLFVCNPESAHLAATVLRLHSNNNLLVSKAADFDVKASLSNKS